MSAIPIRGRRENIRAELIEIANDPAVTGIIIAFVRRVDDEQIMTSINIGPDATRANIALAACEFAKDATE